MRSTQVESRTETLPYRWYVDPEIAAGERERIFRRSWQYAGHVGELDGPASMFPTQAGGLPVVVVRDKDDSLRAFLNVCRHRGTVLVNEPQARGTIQCPYHAWTYGLDGSLRGAPRSKDEPDFDMACLGLVPVQVDTWGPFVFVNPDMDAPGLDVALGSLPEVVADNGLDVDSLRFHHRVGYEIQANWKIAIENYLECYHCQLNHPGFVRLIDEQRQRMEVDGLRLSQFPPIHPDAYTDAAPYDVSDSVPTAQYHILFPAMKFNVNPGRPNLSIGPMWPLATDRTGAWFDYFFAEGTDEAWIEELLEFDDQVGAEDTGLVEAVQRGAASGALEHGRLLTRTEQLIGAFQDMVRTRLV
ncbi:MAG TPA: aromatic ring-hydroxylating dioxygenase subunit alpha [Thermoleophilaceae bacterium]|nr:aromatic ring-hydroxylating dioxygenase subunit alpha [Thermoleophilaceae bacterium]